jgi:hypothetical protein
MRYSINLVRQTRVAERKAEQFRLRISVFSMICFGVLAVAVVFSFFEILSMHIVIMNEHQSVARIKNEYGKYKATRMIVDKADIELLDSLQNSRIFWTRKLTALAVHLPDYFCLGEFKYQPPDFQAAISCPLALQQNQLVTIDDFLNRLRQDSDWHDLFHKTVLYSASRGEQDKKDQMQFQFVSSR